MDSTAHTEQSTQTRRVIVHPQPHRNLVARNIAAATGVQPNAAPATGAQNALPNMVNPNPQQPSAAGSSVQASMNSTAQMHPTQQSTQARGVIIHPQPHRNLVNINGRPSLHAATAVQPNGAGAPGPGARNAPRNMINPNPQQPRPATNSVQGQANVIKDWRDEVYVKIKATKDKYLPQIRQIKQKIVNGLQQHDANPRQENVQHMQRLRLVRTALDQIILFLHVQKANITLNHSAFLVRYQRQIRRFLDFYNPERPIPYVPYAGFCSKYQSTVLRG